MITPATTSANWMRELESKAAVSDYAKGTVRQRVETLRKVRAELEELVKLEEDVVRLRDQANRLSDPLAARDPEMRQIAADVLLDRGCSLDEIRTRSRFMPHVRARWAVMIALHAKGYSCCSIGAFLRHDAGTVRYALKRNGVLS